MLTILTADGKVYYGRLERHLDEGTVISPIFRWDADNNEWRPATLIKAVGFRTNDYPEITDLSKPNG